VKIHYLQHMEFDGPGGIGAWAGSKGHPIDGTHLWANEALPEPEQFDLLVILGGSMSVYDTLEYPWLSAEKRLIGEAVTKGRLVLGLCLGAQLLADVVGGRVQRNAFREIGWHTVYFHHADAACSLFGSLPGPVKLLHWHGDTFAGLPEEAVLFASSEGCPNQGFMYRNRAVGLQFHLEADEQSLTALVDCCGAGLTADKYVQTPEQILAGADHLAGSTRLLFSLLDRLEAIWRLHLSNHRIP
jgi:GMP synthase-like glutamine amidotransferase